MESIHLGSAIVSPTRPSAIAGLSKAAQQGAEIIPVWNKSNREHLIVGSEPGSVRAAADKAVQQLGWNKPYHVDADHIRLETVDRFIPHSDFFTIDVADSIGRPAAAQAVRAFVDRHAELVGKIQDAGIRQAVSNHPSEIEARRGQVSPGRAGRRANLPAHRSKQKGAGNFITEVSMDETDQPADPAGIARHSGRHGGRGHSGADDRAQVHRPV